jgi:hypothetical protein
LACIDFGCAQNVSGRNRARYSRGAQNTGGRDRFAKRSAQVRVRVWASQKEREIGTLRGRQSGERHGRPRIARRMRAVHGNRSVGGSRSGSRFIIHASCSSIRGNVSGIRDADFVIRVNTGAMDNGGITQRARCGGGATRVQCARQRNELRGLEGRVRAARKRGQQTARTFGARRRFFGAATAATAAATMRGCRGGIAPLGRC